MLGQSLLLACLVEVTNDERVFLEVSLQGRFRLGLECNVGHTILQKIVIAIRMRNLAPGLRLAIVGIRTLTGFQGSARVPIKMIATVGAKHVAAALGTKNSYSACRALFRVLVQTCERFQSFLLADMAR